MRNENEKPKKQAHLAQTTDIEEMPVACGNELAAVEYIEKRRWQDCPACVHCGDTNVYKMVDAKTGERSKRFLWRCRGCKKQYTVRIGMVFEESLLPLRYWCYAIWRTATSKKGVAAMEIMRQCQISYKSALFMLNRLRFAMAPDAATMPKLMGTVECDEVWVGGKPRKNMNSTLKGRAGSTKVPVFVAVQRDGNIRRRIIADVTAKTLRAAMKETVHLSAVLMTDEHKGYIRPGKMFHDHQTVQHSSMEYARGDAHINTAESSNALIKRGLMGIYHAVSKEYLHRYLWHWDFLWNHRKLTDGERVTRLIQAADGKRFMYQDATPKGN
jgi:transposase-like protein